ncbi:MAG TPA: tail-specific protease [Firmicutes bacterium]|nr:tail-specific protease [Bacillota bacterium]
MKRLWLIIAIVVVVVVLCTTVLIGKGPTKEDALAHFLYQSLEAEHYNPELVNDQLSKRVYTLYLKSLDPNKRFFLKADIAKFRPYQAKIGDELKRGTAEFYDLTGQIFRQRVREVDLLTQRILQKPFNFTVTENFETDPSKISYPQNNRELLEQWRLYLKYQTLLAYLDLSNTASNAKDKPLKEQSFDPKLEAQARAKVAKSLKISLERMLQKSNEEQIDNYLNAIAGSFDPHTEYMAPESKDDFDINLTGRLEGIGASLKEDGEYIKVAEIIPGSAAWRQKALQADDTILKVAQGNHEPVDVAGMPLTDAVKLIRGKKGTLVKLTVRKPNGRILVIPIVRDVVVIEETYAKSAVIRNTMTGKRYGYVDLPSFYRDYQTNSRNSADDVRAELQKLNTEKVDGIILDLRNNGGGILDDAVRMSGLFIKDGPIVQIKDGSGKTEVLSDTDSSVVYNGPLVILVNSLSASASEILAAALQDYGRAVIVGGTSTFGKGTVQIVADLDQYLPISLSSVKPAGSLRLTIKKFYRVSGGSTQWKGVISDISLPDLYSYLGIQEKAMDYSLPWDTTRAVSYQKWNGRTFNTSLLRQESAERIHNSKAFQLIVADVARLKKQKEFSKESLKFSDFMANQKLLKDEADQLQNLPLAQGSVIQIAKPKADNETSSNPNYSKTQDWLKQIGKDAYINEAWHILDNMNQ